MDSSTLIRQSQQGDDFATEQLLRIIQKEHMPKRIRRYVKRNVLVTQDEIESEFLEGCWHAIRVAKLDIGNPMLFILQKGMYAVIRMMQKRIKEGVRIKCTTCGREGTMAYKDKKVTCPKCGATDVDTHMILISEDQNPDIANESGMNSLWDRLDADDVASEMEEQFSTITHDMAVSEIQAKLSGRVRELFDILVVEQINRETSNNYLAEIADRWGVSTACVSVYLRKLRAAVVLHNQEQQ